LPIQNGFEIDLKHVDSLPEFTHLYYVSSVQEIQAAIQKLPEAEYQSLERWWQAFQEQHWDAKLAQDSKPGGRLSRILDELDADIDSGNVSKFPR
jgi:hypothetical protein